VTHWNPTVHAELAMIIAMVGRLDYIGVSKLSCIMCSHYIRTFRQITGKRSLLRVLMGRPTPGGSGLVILTLTVTRHFVKPLSLRSEGSSAASRLRSVENRIAVWDLTVRGWTSIRLRVKFLKLLKI
jgi:hypothetical protein